MRQAAGKHSASIFKQEIFATDVRRCLLPQAKTCRTLGVNYSCDAHLPRFVAVVDGRTYTIAT
eukprot:4780919-Amphidinium_carterae.1